MTYATTMDTTSRTARLHSIADHLEQHPHLGKVSISPHDLMIYSHELSAAAAWAHSLYQLSIHISRPRSRPDVLVLSMSGQLDNGHHVELWVVLHGIHGELGVIEPGSGEHPVSLATLDAAAYGEPQYAGVMSPCAASV